MEILKCQTCKEYDPICVVSLYTDKPKTKPVQPHKFTTRERRFNKDTKNEITFVSLTHGLIVMMFGNYYNHGAKTALKMVYVQDQSI